MITWSIGMNLKIGTLQQLNIWTLIIKFAVFFDFVRGPCSFHRIESRPILNCSYPTYHRWHTCTKYRHTTR